PKARVNLKLDLHTGGGQKKVELPLKLLVAGDFSNGQEERPLSERIKMDVNKNNFNAVLADISPSVRLNVENTLAGDGTEESISLTFRNMNDFTPEQVARQIPRLKAMLAMRSLLRDLKANLLDNATFRKELEKILRDPELSQALRDELSALVPEQV
ncbi:type VI secretion system contractile sheath small subunit, partial [Escherichia coli]|nr:type VI secretion system contractile sheath small subunit [Escherichia coli]EEQ8776593.1 type VI secretion system contractile sheath small subunit [Escherichia coli]EER2056035.1 type VI secretion system contractile sheath small subunit [Escherichia coli]EET1724274.1 type VI secretion system contractile sheath small subunit [Escherichia coli]EEZ1309099.1 type VI secretion system contractile sheath small subunit [Escherichia coli]